MDTLPSRPPLRDWTLMHERKRRGRLVNRQRVNIGPAVPVEEYRAEPSICNFTINFHIAAQELRFSEYFSALAFKVGHPHQETADTF